MATQTSTQFPDVLDTEFKMIFDNVLREMPDMIPTVYTMGDGGPRGDSFKMSTVGAMDDWPEFTGTVEYDRRFQGFDVLATHVEFASGMKIERKLFDDDQYGIMNKRPAALAAGAVRRKQADGAGIFVNAFGLDSTFYSHSEGVALCSNSHLTNSNASTATGFDNLVTTAFSHTNLVSARTQMRNFRGDRAQVIDINPNELWIPIDIEDQVDEVVNSTLRSDTGENAKNTQQNRWTVHPWIRLTDTNNWFMTDSRMRAENLIWVDRVTPEFAMAEDIDNLEAKWRGYARWSYLWVMWQWILGANVS